MTPGFEVHEATIAEMRAAMEGGRTTAVGLLEAYLARITAYDGHLNAVVVRNPDARADAEASDARRREGRTYGPLDGIPYTAKDSYQARGLTVAAGSPAFTELVAQRDSFVVERLRAAEQGEFTVHHAALVAGFFHDFADEAGCRINAGIEIRRFDLVAPARVAEIERGDVDGGLDLGFAPVAVVEREEAIAAVRGGAGGL